MKRKTGKKAFIKKLSEKEGIIFNEHKGKEVNSNDRIFDFKIRNILSSSSDKSEDFNWLKDKNCENYIKQYSSFPLREWKKLTYDKIKEGKLLRVGTSYQNCVNTILELDVFKNEYFSKESMLYKAIDNEEISPDFYIKNIEKKRFMDIINDRGYMFIMNYEIPQNIKKLNIIGEIKCSKNSQKSRQKSELFSYAKRNSSLEIIFDSSYKVFC